MAPRSVLLAAGVGVLVLAGCGAQDDTLIPQDKADQISALVADAGQASASGECDAAQRAARDAQQQVGALPRRTDKALKANLRDWISHLEDEIAEECEAAPEETPEPTATARRRPRRRSRPRRPRRPRRRRPTETATPEPTATVDPGTGGEEGPTEEPPGSGGVPPGDG